MQKPILQIDTKPLVDYLVSQIELTPHAPFFATDNPKVQAGCKAVMPYPLDVGFSWLTEDHEVDWEKIQIDLKENFALYLLNNWIRIGFFLSEDGNFEVIRPEGMASTHETLAAALQNKEPQ